MKRVQKKSLVFCIAILTSLVFFFQNCGPAKLSGGASDGSQINYNSVGAKVDLQALLQSPVEEASNVLYPDPSTSPRYDYAQMAPVIENIVLKNNDLSRIEWVHEPTATVVAVGETFQSSSFSSEMLGRIYVFGYRGARSFLLSQFLLVEKTSTSLGVNSANAVQIQQAIVAGDLETEVKMITVEAPAVDLNSVQFINKKDGSILSGKRAVLISKKRSEAVDIEVVLTDVSGQSLSRTVNLPISSSPPPETNPSLPQVLQLGSPSLTVLQGQNATMAMRFVGVPMKSNHMVSVHFVSSTGGIYAGGDHSPPVSTSSWNGPVNYNHSRLIPTTMPPGDYTIRVGLFSGTVWAPMEPGPSVTADSQTRYIVGTLKVEGPPTAVRTSGNLLSNPGFESGLTGWINWGNSVVVTDQVAAGTSAVRVGTVQGGFGQPMIDKMTAGSQYRFSGLGKVASASESIYLGIKFTDSAGAIILDKTVQVNSTSYKAVAVEITAPENAMRGYPYIWKNNGVGSYGYVDELSFVAISKAAACSYPDWQSSQAYIGGDIVKHTDGKFYIARFAHSGLDPAARADYWDVFTCVK